MKIQELHLFTSVPLAIQKDFYAKVLGFECFTESEQAISFQAGQSTLHFRWSEDVSYYHFAFNIPFTQMKAALAWVKARVAILADGTQEIIDFPAWKANAIYFKDPAGNILEFIGRKDIPSHTNDSFSIQSILNISEIGLPSNDVLAYRKQLEERISVPHYSGDSPRFMAMGDPEGLFILVNQNEKLWYPTETPAKAFPLEVIIHNQGKSFKLAVNQFAHLSLTSL